MRILVVHNTLNDSRSLSGALRHFLHMANEWAALGHETDFLAAECARPQITSHCPRARFLVSDRWFDATKYLAQTWRYFPAYGWRMATCHATRAPVRYDVVLASTQLIVEVYPALVLARRHKAKFVAKVHHVLAAQEKRTGLFDKLFLWSERRTMRWMNRHGDLVICGTPFVEREYHALEERLGLPRRENTTSVGYGVDLAAMPLAWGRPRRFDAVHLGRLHEHKGVFELPAVWKKVLARRPGAKLVVIGEGPHRARTEELCRGLGIADSVTFTGGVDERTKNELVSQSRVGLSLSYEEGWGLSINEFLAAGLPVAAYHLPIFDVVFPGQLAYAARGEQEKLAGHIAELLGDEARQREVGLRGREFVQRYDFRNVARTELGELLKLFPS